MTEAHYQEQAMKAHHDEESELASLRARVEELERGRSLTCAFCGAIYPPGTPTSQHELLTAHVKKCEKHPLNQRIAELLAACSAKDEALAECAIEKNAKAERIDALLKIVDKQERRIGEYAGTYGTCPCGAPATVMLDDENVCKPCAAMCAHDEALAALEPLVRALDLLAMHGPNVAQVERETARALLRARGGL